MANDKKIKAKKATDAATKRSAPARTRKAAPKAAAKPAAPVVTPEQRHKMVELEAYYRAEKLGWQVDSHANWVAAEAIVDARLARELGLKK